MKFVLILVTSFCFSLFSGAQSFVLMWEDTFDNPVLNELQHWTVEIDGKGGGNNELQYYRRENISIEQHTSGVNCLVISAKRENFAGRVATSGRLVTRAKVAAKYGKIEARIKLPTTANGLWPAFWLMGEDYPTVGWPRCGEIDVLEMGNVNGITRGTQDRYFNGACHWGESHAYYAQDFTAPYSLQDDFHLYTLIWDPVSIKMYLDLDKYPTNAPYFQMKIDGSRAVGQTSYYFHKPFSILLNLAVGGNFTGITGNSNIDKITALPSDGTPVKMYVDYVRIYQKGEAGEEFYGPGNSSEPQQTLNYETYGHNWAWTLFSNGDNAPSLYAVVDNPSMTGINTSPKCARYTINASGAPWAGIWSDNLGSLTFTPDNCIVRVMVYKNVISDFDIKFEGAGGLNFEKKVKNTVVNQWEQLTLDFSDHIGSTVTRMVIFPDFPTTRTAGSINYWDNISFNSKNTSRLEDISTAIIQLHPNPVAEQLSILSNETISSVEIRTVVGQLISVVNIEHSNNTINLSHLDSGQYLLTIRLNNGELITKKVLKI